MNFLRKFPGFGPISTRSPMCVAVPTTAVCLTPEDIVREVKHLPSAPKVLPRLKRLLMDGNSAMQEIVALIRLDPGIAARVLQVANSAYFSKGVRCTIVDEAVNRVGVDQIYELVSYAVSSQVLVRPLDCYGIEADEVWKMSVSCALAAEALAKRTGQEGDVAYTIGLLHCVGMVAIDEWNLRSGQRLQLEFRGFPHEAVASEREIFGFTQADVGGALMRDWEFAPTMSEPVRHQYAPGASAVHSRLASLLVVAKWVRGMVCGPLAAGEMPALPEQAHLARLGLRPPVLAEVVTEVQQRIAEVSSLLEIESEVRVARHAFPAQQWR